MSKLTLLKAETFALGQMLLDGALVGTQVDRGIRGLRGKTLIFTQPAAATVTFTGSTTSGDPDLWTLKDIKTLAEAAIAGLKVMNCEGRIVFIESTPANGVALTGAGTANTLFGFDGAASLAGRVINPQDGAPPRLMLVDQQDNRLIFVIAEV